MDEQRMRAALEAYRQYKDTKEPEQAEPAGQCVRVNLLGELPGYKVEPTAYPLRLSDGSVDELRACGCLQRYSHTQTGMVLHDWARVLKPGGVLKVSVPDFGHAAQAFLDQAPGVDVQSEVMGRQWDELDFHRSIWSDGTLEEALKGSGLIDVKPWLPGVVDDAAAPGRLNLQGTKPHLVATQQADAETEPDAVFEPVVVGGRVSPAGGFERVREQLAAAGVEKAQPQVDLTPWRERCRSIKAIMTAPRLGFLDNIFCIYQGLVPLGIDVYKNHGVFWGQCLTKLFETVLRDAEYILTLDYDTVFRCADIMELIRLMDAHPEADAIVPMEVKRENMTGLFTVLEDPADPASLPRANITLGELQPELLRVASAHFGCTLFRAAALRKMERPWFLPQPDPQGRWEAGHVDEDIWFWKQLAKTGGRCYLATRMAVGHMQLMVTWPNKLLNGVLHQHISRWEQDGKPHDAWAGVAINQEEKKAA
ncbi:MAG: hypothetical protein WC718_19045 [Phycisphaerales bacterium]|jgi:hypothetical protein